jgi:hypothetical protein
VLDAGGEPATVHGRTIALLAIQDDGDIQRAYLRIADPPEPEI